MTLSVRARFLSALLPLSVLLSHCAPALASDWLVLSGASYHFKQNQRDWRQTNPGIGMERESTRYQGLSWTAGYFLNSYDRHTFYGGARWMPYRLGPFAFGGYALAASGYHWPVVVAPGMSIEAGNIGLNFVVVPNLPDHSGFVAAQLRFRLR